jgi:hypothetical protein
MTCVHMKYQQPIGSCFAASVLHMILGAKVNHPVFWFENCPHRSQLPALQRAQIPVTDAIHLMNHSAATAVFFTQRYRPSKKREKIN